MEEKRFENIFGLDPNAINQFKRICGAKKTKMEKALLLFNNKQAVGSATNYKNVIRDFQEHCKNTPGLNFDNFAEKEIGDFILSKDLKDLKQSYMCVGLSQRSVGWR